MPLSRPLNVSAVFETPTIYKPKCSLNRGKKGKIRFFFIKLCTKEDKIKIAQQLYRRISRVSCSFIVCAMYQLWKCDCRL